MLSLLDYFAVALAVAATFGLRTYYRRRSRPFPPGPPGKLFVGNARDFHPKSAWITFTKWKETYGDLIGLNALGTKIVVLNSEKVINDLLDKRGAMYSDRPKFTVLGELMGLERSMALKPYGPEWRACRKLEHIALNPVASKQYAPMQEHFAATLVSEIIDDPSNFYNLVRLCTSRIVLSLTYGMSAPVIDPQFISHGEKTMEMIGRSMVPGAFLADLLPVLKHLPGWVPFQKKVAKGKQMLETFVNMPYNHVKKELSDGVAGPSLTRDLLLSEKEEMSPLMEERIKWTTGSMFGAGGETTAGTILAFIIAMAQHPDKQAKAQAEIDAVIGSDRLPTVADRPALPYVDALVKEVMRWHPMLPLSIARRVSKDNWYNGYLIPKDAIVMPNSWQIAFEPNDKYPPPDFIPERFLDPDHPTKDPSTWAFGYGRRICPGKALGESSVFILIATLLATLDIAPPPPSEGPIKRECKSSLAMLPRRFKCTITPREDAKAELARRAAAVA